MKLGTKLPPGLINLPRTAFVFLCNAPNASFILSEGAFGSHSVDGEEAAFKKLRSGSRSRTSAVCAGKINWGGGGRLSGVSLLGAKCCLRQKEKLERGNWAVKYKVLNM